MLCSVLQYLPKDQRRKCPCEPRELLYFSELVIAAFSRGACSVWGTSLPPQVCHYSRGSAADRSQQVLRKLSQKYLHFQPDSNKLYSISANETTELTFCQDLGRKDLQESLQLPSNPLRPMPSQDFGTLGDFFRSLV